VDGQVQTPDDRFLHTCRDPAENSSLQLDRSMLLPFLDSPTSIAFYLIEHHRQLFSR
jgi:hypothetical protein